MKLREQGIAVLDKACMEVLDQGTEPAGSEQPALADHALKKCLD